MLYSLVESWPFKPVLRSKPATPSEGSSDFEDCPSGVKSGGLPGLQTVSSFEIQILLKYFDVFLAFGQVVSHRRQRIS